MIDTKYPCIEFNAQDRCDRCPAQAYAAASRDGLELLFCGHHIKEYRLALEQDGWLIAVDAAAWAEITPEEVIHA